MKKIIIAAAVASVLAPVAAIADAKLYGAFRYSLNTGDQEALVNNASRLGIKGSIGEDGGPTGFYNIQMGFDNDSSSSLSNRFAFAGVKGGFGKVMAGRASHPYKMAGLKVDPFYDTSAGPANGGSNYGLSSETNGFKNNFIGYVSPKLGGAFTINVAGMLDGLDDEGGEDKYNVGVNYAKGNISASVQHLTEYDATRLAGSYKAGPAKIGLSYEMIDDQDANAATANDDSTQLYLSGTYKVAPKTTLAASIGQVDDNGTGVRNSAGDGFTVGVFQKVASKTTVSLIHSTVDYDGATTDRDVTSLGLVQKF